MTQKTTMITHRTTQFGNPSRHSVSFIRNKRQLNSNFSVMKRADDRHKVVPASFVFVHSETDTTILATFPTILHVSHIEGDRTQNKRRSRV